MIELSFVVLNPVDSFLADRANVTQAYTIDFNEVIHFSENNAMMSADIRGQEMPIDIIYQRIKETDGVKISCVSDFVTDFIHIEIQRWKKTSSQMQT